MVAEPPLEPALEDLEEVHLLLPADLPEQVELAVPDLVPEVHRREVRPHLSRI